MTNLKVEYVVGFMFEPIIVIHYIPIVDVEHNNIKCIIKDKSNISKRRDLRNKRFGKDSKFNVL